MQQSGRSDYDTSVPVYCRKSVFLFILVDMIMNECAISPNCPARIHED